MNLAFRLAEDVPNLKNIGRRDLAAERIAEADRSVDRIDDPGTASMARARVDLTHGQFLLDETPRRAAALFDSAIDVYRRRGDAFPIPSLQLDRGRALLRAGAVADAEAAFADGVSASERERHTVVAEADRVLALSARWDLYASLVDLRILRRDDTGALALLERARALKASSSVDGTAPISTVVLPPGTLAIEYAVLPSGMVGWVIAGSERGRFDVALGVPALEELVSDYRTAVQRRADRRVVSELSRRIFAAVLGPVRDRLRHATHLIIVADGPLHDVPFAALEDPQTGRALVEDATVAMSPSLESLNPRQVETEPRRLRALVVGNPDRTGAAGETLGELPASLREAEDVARMYSGARLSVGSAATRQLFLERLPQVDVVHFAGHAIVNDRQPQLSRLMLAPAKDDSIGAVFASDIDRLDLSRLRLVVLSACETARGRVARGSGVIGLVRTFLAAGANTVVATLWPIDDRSAANLFTAFHARWVGGLSAADALRQAQLALRNAGRADVIDWAGAEVVGMSVIP